MDRLDLARESGGGESTRLTVAAAGALALSVIHQYLFMDRPFGLSVPLFFALFLMFLFWVAGRENRSGTPFAWAVLGGIVLLSMTYVWFSNPVFQVLNIPALALLVSFYAVLHTGQGGKAWYGREMAFRLLYHLVPKTIAAWPVPFRLLRNRLAHSSGRNRMITAGKLAIGIVIATPVVLLVTGLLMSADKAFEETLSFIPGWFEGFPVDEWIARGVWTFVIFLLVFGFVWGLAGERSGDRTADMTGSFGFGLTGDRERADAPGVAGGSAAIGSPVPVLRPMRFDPVIVFTVLCAVNLVYALFAVVQFSYLFGAWDGVLPDGRTYAEHARSGFFELVAVGVINFVLLAICLTFSHPKGQAQSRLQRWLLTALMAGTLVMLVSAFIRLGLYEKAYGYTLLRFMVHAFLIYMGILLAASLFRIWREGVSLVRLFIIISLAAWLVINHVGVDRQVAALNIARHEAGGELDAAYFRRLSHDAVPVLIEASRKYPDIRSGLENRLESLRREDRPPLSFNWSSHRAIRLLEAEFR